MKFDFQNDTIPTGLKKLTEYLNKTVGENYIIYVVQHELLDPEFELKTWRGIVAVWVSDKRDKENEYYINVDFLSGEGEASSIDPLYRIKTAAGIDKAFEIAKHTTKFMGACK